MSYTGILGSRIFSKYSQQKLFNITYYLQPPFTILIWYVTLNICRKILKYTTHILGPTEPKVIVLFVITIIGTIHES